METFTTGSSKEQFEFVAAVPISGGRPSGGSGVYHKLTRQEIDILKSNQR
jgi:hypothetical protein